MVNIIPTEKAMDSKETIERDTGRVLTIDGRLENPKVLDCHQYKLEAGLDRLFMDIFGGRDD